LFGTYVADAGARMKLSESEVGKEYRGCDDS
jgi:hypothetical protein